MPDYSTDLHVALQAQIRTAASAYALPYSLIAAQVTVESGGNQYAHNPEPKYHYMWDVRLRRPFRPLTPAEIASEIPPDDFYAILPTVPRDAEWQDQQASWGLMQVMGAVAREMGFRGPFLTQLVEPVLNLDFGCRKLAGELKWAHGNVPQALAAYNGGRRGNETPPYRNQEYADKVLRLVK